MVRVCIKCGAADRYAKGDCRPCTRTRQEEYRKANTEKIVLASAVYREANSEKVALAKAKWRETNPGYNANYYAKHKEKASLRSRGYREKNREKVNKCIAAWVKNNPGKHNAMCKRHKAAKMRATPAWANQALILAFYEQAQRLTKETGVKHHVDHIVPLQGKTVTGFHCEANLQVITARSNISKSNRFWPDQPRI